MCVEINIRIIYEFF